MLKLNRMTDYGIVVLGALAQRQGEIVPTASLAELTGLKQPTVAKVAKLLLATGLLETQRGAAGGYRLGAPASSISLVQIIESIEGPIAVNDCVDGAQDPCAISSGCFMSGNWNKVNATLRAALQQMSLADLLDPAQLFPAMPNPAMPNSAMPNPATLNIDNMPGDTAPEKITNIFSVEREDEPNGCNHPDN
jgi:FeS assembly SUF system regulator